MRPSALALISPASPPGADSQDGGAVGPDLTPSRQTVVQVSFLRMAGKGTLARHVGTHDQGLRVPSRDRGTGLDFARQLCCIDRRLKRAIGGNPRFAGRAFDKIATTLDRHYLQLSRASGFVRPARPLLRPRAPEDVTMDLLA